MSNEHSGNKYHRVVRSVLVLDDSTVADVYSVLVAFDVKCPAIQHAVKKLLCAGLRGKGDRLQDLKESKDAITRAIELETQLQNSRKVNS